MLLMAAVVGLDLSRPESMNLATNLGSNKVERLREENGRLSRAEHERKKYNN